MSSSGLFHFKNELQLDLFAFYNLLAVVWIIRLSLTLISFALKQIEEVLRRSIA